jgi:hypothetical protein
MKPTTSSPLAFLLVLASSARFAAAGDTITQNRIKVQLFAAPSFLSEVSVDAYNNQCLSLDNNLFVPPIPARCGSEWGGGGLMEYRIDGRVQSILVGGHDVATVLQRDDYWNCKFYEYVISLNFFFLCCVGWGVGGEVLDIGHAKRSATIW